ncbi:MAG: nucleotidyltransferase domain-containing protein [Thermoproteota archaeon]|nr:sugar transporter [Candidatus Brockarchaeota archaeon]
MSRLRILEEEKRRSKSMPWSKREKVLERLLKLLYEHREILLAVAHGGFVNSNIFRDVDIAVYTRYAISYDEEPVYVDELKEDLEKEVNLPIDVQLLDYAPPAFKLAALRGKLLLERISGLRALLRLHAAEEFEALKLKTKKSRILN